MVGRRERLRGWATRLKKDLHALVIATKHPRTPRIAKALAISVVAYAFSPIDLIPDFIPVLGYLDDLLILPAGIWLTLRLIPEAVWFECQEKARGDVQVSHRARIVAAVAIGVLWLAFMTAAVRLIWPLLASR